MKKSNLILSIIAIILLLAALTFTIYQITQNLKQLREENPNQQDNTNFESPAVTQENSEEKSALDLNLENENSNVEPQISDENKLVVQWLAEPQLVANRDFFNLANASKEIKAKSKYIEANFKVYKTGQLNDQEIFTIAYNEPVELAFDTESIYRVLKKDNQRIILSKQSAGISETLNALFEVNDQAIITNLEPPAEIAIPNSNLKLVKDDNMDTEIMFLGKGLFKYNDQDYVYKDNNMACFIALAGDHTYRTYYLDLNFLKDSNTHDDIYGYNAQVLNFTLLNGQKNQEEYFSKSVGVCGSSGCYKFANYITGIKQLKIVGQTSANGPIYELADTNLIEFKEVGKPLLNAIYDDYYPGTGPDNKDLPKESFEDFLKTHPVLYWQDPFGSFIEFRNAKYAPAAECGKPVIYLYPTQDTDINVRVYPTGGFSLTEPAYNNGWYVKASPQSELYNYADQKTYPYLFWEGYATGYAISNEGFVVAQKNVEKFLQTKLAYLGLNNKETAEFLDFWLPRMQDKPYYFINFVPQEKFEQMAPLQIEPKPETIIRVFMDYKGLDQPIKVKPQNLIPRQRQGYTVVEWGGELLP